jgi:hypothetical protein
VETLIFSVPDLLIVTLIMFLALFVFAIVGNAFFGQLPQSEQYNGINSLYNFGDFHHAFFSTIFWSSGFDWELALQQSMESKGNGAALYWVAFIVITQYILASMFTLAMIEVFDSNYVVEFNPKTLYAEMEEDFLDRWVKLSCNGRGLRLKEHLMVELILNMNAPLGYDFAYR